MAGPNPNVSDGRNTVRTTVTLPKEDHQELERIAEQKKVSLAWVVRDAVEQYLAQQAPLFRQ